MPQKKIVINGRTLVWRLDLKSFHHAETKHGVLVSLGKASEITMGGFPELFWCGLMADELDTGADAPDLDEVIDWLDEVPGSFAEYVPIISMALNKIADKGAPKDDDDGADEVDPASPFSTGPESSIKVS